MLPITYSYGLRKEKDIVTLRELMMSEMDEHTFGKFVRFRREQLGMSVRCLASKLNMTAAYLSDIEKGNRYAPAKYLDKLREFLQISDEDKGKFEKLAAAAGGFLSDDIQPLARIALRRAQIVNVPDEMWIAFIEKMDELEAEHLQSMNKDI